MFTVRKHIELDAGHRVPYHSSKCRNLHGHRYRVTAVVESPELVSADSKRSDAGMVVDFGVIKSVLMDKVHQPCDHKLLLWDQDPIVSPELYIMLEREGIDTGVVLLPCIPTAEELARYWGQSILQAVDPTISEGSFAIAAPRAWDARLRLVAIEVMETPTSVATWTPPRPIMTFGEA